MWIKCTNCGSEVSLEHEVFNDYQGPVKCFSCGMMIEIRTSGGILDSINSSALFPELPTDIAVEHTS